VAIARETENPKEKTSQYKQKITQKLQQEQTGVQLWKEVIKPTS